MTDNRFIIVIGLDIEDYTNRTIARQLRAQKFVESWIIDACQHSDIAQDIADIKWIDAGDGGYLVFETSYAKAIPFLESFHSSQTHSNADTSAEAIVNVRAAIHCNDVQYWQGKLGDKYAGNAINICARILNGMQRHYSNQVVCSGEYVRKVCNVDSLVDALRLPDYVDKHGQVHEIWNICKVPGFGIKPNEDDLHEDPNEWRL